MQVAWVASMVHLRMLLDQIASDAVLEDAYAWLCHRRRDYPANADVWSLRRDWPIEKRRLQVELRGGTFRFGLLDRIQLVFHVRFMDDILVLAPTRWRVRRAVRLVNATLAHLGLEKHPDKTFIGRISRGFDFLGYHFSPAGQTMARATVQRAIECVARLYEQERRGRTALVGPYLRRWTGWVRGGLGGLCVRPSLSYPTQAEEAAQSGQQKPRRSG